MKACKEVIAASQNTNSHEVEDPTVRRNLEMLTTSRALFDRPIDGHRKALLDLNVDNIEAVCHIHNDFMVRYVCSGWR